MNTSAVSPKLSVFERQILEFVESKRHLAQGVCLATKTLAARFGVTIRYVQKALKRLRELGLVAREWDYNLRTRRRFYLGSGQPLLVNEQEFVQSTNLGAPTDDSPPISALERAKKESGDGGTEDTPPPPFVQPSDPKHEGSGPSAEAVREVVARVIKATRPDPTFPARVAGIARKWGHACLVAAVARLEEKAKAEMIREPMGYLVNTIKGFVEQGGPPPVLTEEEHWAAQSAKFEAEIAAFNLALSESS